ncbi:fimbrial protein [Enterobacter cloacae]|uniref:fimbrial protein n=1 Tax=Enterobacter cloacae TaxID=550 RepID=UPI000B8D2848|nr:spore coat protein U domain-containing protein [Enterobacter cloacae]ASQ15703.1 hypothetical protein BJM06_a00054 [Enterobacter cloacae]
MKKNIISALLCSAALTGGAFANTLDSISGSLSGLANHEETSPLLNTMMQHSTTHPTQRFVGGGFQKIEGVIAASTCTVTIPSDINFGTISSSTISDAAVGSTLKSQGANIELSKCAPNTNFRYKIHALGDRHFTGTGESALFSATGVKHNGLKLYMKNSSDNAIFTDGTDRGFTSTSDTGDAVVPINISLIKAAASVDTGPFFGGYLYLISQA